MTHPANWILAATDLGPMIVNRHDQLIVSETSYIGVGAQLLNSGTYDPSDCQAHLSVLNLLRHYRAPDGQRAIVALDGGANVGAFTIPWARAMRGWGDVIAVEPQDQVFYALCGNVVLNNLGNVLCLNLVLGNKPKGMDPFPRADFGAAGSFGSIGVTNLANDSGQPLNTVRWVKRINVNQLADDYSVPIDFLKMDLEGNEILALQGAAHVLEQDRPILCVEHIKSGCLPIKEILEPLGFVCFVDNKDVWAVHKDDPVRPHVTMNGERA